MKKYVVIGRPRAGSLIAEFLLTAANVEYEFKNISIEAVSYTHLTLPTKVTV